MSHTGSDIPPPRQMLQMITGYWVSQLVGGLARLGVMDALADKPQTAAELAVALRANEGALARVLRTSASLGLVREDAGRYLTTPLGDTLRRDVPGSLCDMAVAQTAAGHWLPWGLFADAVRTGERTTRQVLGAEIWEHYARTPDEGAAFAGAMHDLASLVAGEIVRLLDFKSATRVVDVGGASGTLVAAILASQAHLSGCVLDLPHVVDAARQALDKTPVGRRCEVVAGNFFEHVPEGDTFVLKQILHDWDDAQCETILENCAKSMKKGGRVVVVEMLLPDVPAPVPAQLFDLNMLVMLPGRERTRAEYARLLEAAGLRIVRVHETRSPFQIIEAE